MSLHLDYEMPVIEIVFVTPDGVPHRRRRNRYHGHSGRDRQCHLRRHRRAAAGMCRLRRNRVKVALESAQAHAKSADGMKRRFFIFLLCAAAAFPGLPVRLSSTEVRAAAPTGASTLGNNVSASAFEAIVPVLRHPRCMNCH